MFIRGSPGRRSAAPGKTPRENFLERLLDPIDLLSETIFAILVLLTFTLAFVYLEFNADPDYVPTPANVSDLVLSVLGATLGWGLINGVLYALLAVFERGEKHRLLAAIQNAATQEEGIEALAEELDFVLEPITRLEKRRLLYKEILAHLSDSHPQDVTLTRADVAGALGCVAIAVLAVLPSLAPFVLLRNNFDLAIRISNLISFGVLFFAGYQWGKYSGVNPWRVGALLAVLGVILAAIAIPLGG